MINVYVLKNNLVKTYSLPQYRYEDFRTVTKQLHDFIILEPDKALEQKLNVSTIYHIGTFDEESGKFDLFEDSVILEYNLQEAWDQLKALKEQIS